MSKKVRVHTESNVEDFGLSEGEFSRASPFYDADLHANPIARWARRRSLQVLARSYTAGDRVLEIGCGSGEEAICLAQRGVAVVATDAALGMIEVLRAKMAAASESSGWPKLITPLVLPAGRLAELAADGLAGGFDGAYSSFGPLNCEPSLEPVVDALAQMVRPGGPVVISMINRYCAWETAWYMLAGSPQIAFRRWSGQASATVRAEWAEGRIRVYYWTPGEVEDVFYPHFRIVRRMGLPWLLPPFYLHHLVRRVPRLMNVLARVDRRYAATWPTYHFGDHFLLEMMRTGK
jgi:SAM-dependent methyltransferase